MPPSRQQSNFDRDIGSLQATVSMLAEAMRDQALVHERTLRAQQEQTAHVIAEFKGMVADANKQIKDLRDEIITMRSLIDQARGGWKILVGVGTISATLGALMAKIASLFIAAPIK